MISDESAGSYRPSPISTDGIELSDELTTLREVLARNAHEVWAARRIADGWSYGSARDDDHKHNPNLVPYEDLSDSEKAYDRDIVDETLRAMVAIGCRIVVPPEVCGPGTG